jgi:hypothetical protein
MVWVENRKKPSNGRNIKKLFGALSTVMADALSEKSKSPLWANKRLVSKQAG